jgi:S-formylglutathione hydrolase
LLTWIWYIGGIGIEGEDESWDFGTGAGFYVNATREPWSKAYNMYSYIVDELPKALFAAFEQLDGSRVSIMGHSMGGHGALTIVSRFPSVGSWNMKRQETLRLSASS